MSVLMLLAAIAVLAVAGYLLVPASARWPASAGNPRLLHSLPHYYGWYGALSVLIPALAALAIWLIVQPMVIETRISADLPAELVADPTTRAS